MTALTALAPTLLSVASAPLLLSGQFLYYGLAFGLFAVLAGLAGFRGIAGLSMELARILVLVFLVLAVVAILF